jgi:hypothetical protein
MPHSRLQVKSATDRNSLARGANYRARNNMVDTMDPDPRHRIVGAKQRIQQIDVLLRTETNPKKCMALKAERARCKKLILLDTELVRRYYTSLHTQAA